MAPQTPSPTSPAGGPSAAMFHKSTCRNIEGSEFCNSARDMFKIVLNYYSGNRSAVSGGTGQVAGTGKEVENEFHDVIDYLLNIIPLLLKEVGKNQSRSSVSKTSGADGSGLLSQGITTDHTPQSPIVEGYSVDMNDIMPSESSLPVPTITDRYIQSTQITPHAPQSSTLEGDLAQVSNLVPSDPSSLPVTCIADRYARSMLKCMHGYPLYEPEPFSELSKEYLRNGVHIGDVGFVRGDGVFDFLFNICPSQGSLINPSDLSGGFYLETHSATRPMTPHPRKTYIFESPITRTNSGKYSCEKSEGAILELPEGAIEHEAINIGPFKKLAARHGVQWYNYTMNRGRDIPNGSLYLITSFTKCTQWGIAIFNQPCAPGQGLRFGSKASFPFCKPNPKYHWKGSGAFTTKVAKPNQTDAPNQCVFLRGYKIMIRQDIFNNLCKDQPHRSGTTTPSLSPQTGGSNPKRGPAQRIRGGGGTDFISRILTRTPTKTSNVTQSDKVILHANFNSSLIHPSDLINAALLSQNPSAQVALTHDDVWCDLLWDDFPKPNHGTLVNIARLYSSTVDKYGCVSLEKISDPSNDESCSVQGIEAPQAPIQPKSSSTPDETPMSIDQEKNNNMCRAIVYKIHGNIAIFEFGDGHYTEQERDMIRDHLSNTVTFEFMDYNDVVKTMKKHSLAQSILNLPNPQAACSDYQIKKKHVLCSNGTRVPLLQEMADWVTGTDETRIYVLSGLARIGKTTVALTIATRADDLGLLGASFFFARDEANRANAKMFFTAIAYQLCLYSEPLAKAIEVALLTKPDPDTMDPQEQLDALILEPLWSIVRRRIRPILIVVDALDECSKEDGISVLTGLSQLVRELPCFKVVLTKRPHCDFDPFFHSQDGHQIFHLHNMEDKIVNDDTEPYTEYNLSQKSVRERFQEPLEASNKLVEPLIGAVGKLFTRVEAPSIGFSSNYEVGNSELNQNVYEGSKDGLEKLKEFVSFDAQFDSSAQDPERLCHPGTRENVLKRLRDWVDNPSVMERIFWLYGPTGAGKSAIAQTIARSYNQQKIPATFFFRSDVGRGDGNRLITTLAYQLAFSFPTIRDHIVHSLNEHPDLPMMDVETQFYQLLVRPFYVLSKEATQQFSPVIIIDGIDECIDEKLQSQFLKVIGDAVRDHGFLLRFLIFSRPEIHIEQIIRRFQMPVLSIDLAEFDNANRDIAKYLKDEFSRIASKQDLGPTWPGQAIIEDIVYKSSGNFTLPSLIIRFVDDPNNVAKVQLDIVLNLKPKTMSPFAVLDQLFLEILRRVVDQDFLKRYLALLVARIDASSYYELYKDDAVLMHVSEKELRTKLGGMRSLLRLQTKINLSHRSFIDFLHDSSRSGQYCIGKRSGIRQYVEVFVDSLVRYISIVIEQPTHHSIPHFTPAFRAIIKEYPPKIKLGANEWQEVTQPLMDLQDKLLQLPSFSSTRDLLRCDECTVFHLLREFLLLRRLLGFGSDAPAVQSIVDVRNRRGVISLITTRTKENMNDNDLDSVLPLLLADLPETMENWSPSKEVVNLTSALLRFDYIEIATRVCSTSDAQKLVDFLDCMIHATNALSRINPDATHKATLLALEIFARVPILPLSFFLNGNQKLHQSAWRHKILPVQILSQTIFASRILDCHYIVPVFVVEGGKEGIMLANNVDQDDMTMKQWRVESLNLMIPLRVIMLEVAKAIRYFHSAGVILHRAFGSDDILFHDDVRLGSGLRVNIRCLCSTSPILLDEQCKEWFLPEDNIFSFGCLLYELYFNVDIESSSSIEARRRIITRRLSKPEIPGYAWQLIQRCCAKDPESRPTIDQVVKEMERW